MKRIAALLVVLATGVAVFASLGASQGPGGYRVDAIFDNADFLVSGQDVKIAGAVEGQVVGVHVTPQHKARVELAIQQGFAPFRSDASCTIRPESLIGEKFVDCDPGSPSGRLLPTGASGTPTVPLAQDHSPIDLDLVLTALRLPYRERLSLLVNELGTGLAGRPAELNAAVRRANPALQQANRVLAIVDRDRATLGRLVDASDTVLAQLASRRGQVADFVDRASRVAKAVADRRGDLGQAIHGLPPMLAQLEPASQQLAGLAGEARPVARDLSAAAPAVNEVVGDLPQLNDAALPTLDKLDTLATTGRRAVRHAEPVASALLPVAQRLPETSLLAGQLNENLKARGVVEGLLQFVYLSTAATARFDRFSHILPSYQISGTCQVYAETPAQGCSARWGGAQTQTQTPQGKQRAASRGQRRRHRRRHHRHRGAQAPVSPGVPGQAPPPASPLPASPVPLPHLPGVPSAPSGPQVQQLLNYLLRP